MPLLLDLASTSNIIDIVLTPILVVAIIYIAVRCKFSIQSIILLTALFVAYILLSIFDINIASHVIFLFTLVMLFIACLFNISSIRGLFYRRKNNQVNKKSGPNKLIDRDELYSKIYETVAACSRQKIGALITFEKRVDLTSIMKNGTVINAPVTPELLTTIFYPGTRLHDGAVIIRGDMIYAASVYYTPTTEALAGKYGSRHRAAIGISEVSDSVTVVVSEETGRISIAQYGELESVTLDDFVMVLSEKIASSD